MTTATSDLMIAVESFVANVDGTDVVIQEGQTLDASHELVSRLPDSFVPVNSPTYGRPTSQTRFADRYLAELEEQDRLNRERERAEFEKAARSNPVRLSPPAIVTATRDFTAVVEGVGPALVRKGSKVLADDPIVIGNPGIWK